MKTKTYKRKAKLSRDRQNRPPSRRCFSIRLILRCELKQENLTQDKPQYKAAIPVIFSLRSLKNSKYSIHKCQRLLEELGQPAFNHVSECLEKDHHKFHLLKVQSETVMKRAARKAKRILKRVHKEACSVPKRA